MLNTVQNGGAGSLLYSIADIDDVLAAYILILGRHAESMSMARERTDMPVLDIVSDFLRSPEFRQIANTVMDGGGLPHYRLTGADYAKAARWIARILDTPVPSATINWWLILAMLLRTDESGATLDELDLAGFRETVTSMAEAEAEQATGITPFLTFDQEWFLRANEKAALAIAGGVYSDAGAFYLDNCLDAEMQLLPAFSDGMKTVADRLAMQADPQIEDVVREIFNAAQSGMASHWLFSPTHYQRGAERRTNTALSDKASSPYLQFLADDAESAVASPHPLFCYHAYRTLNHGAKFKYGTTFRDYVSDGCFADRVTSSIFDVSFYLAANAKARYAVLTKTHHSALHHFLTVGIREGLPFSPDFDADYYLQRYPDVRASIEDRETPSAAWHFVYFGLADGKAPNPYFNAQYYRERHPHAPEEMRRLGIRSEIEHFLMIGKARGYKPERPLVTSTPALDASKAVFQRRARRSFNNIIRAPLDFEKYGKGAVKLSIVVPVYDEVEFTSRFLDCAYFAAAFFTQATKLGCEIIVVDNGSTDWTERVVRSCRGVKLVSYDRPIGFPRAANAGVVRSTGEVVVVANNDIEFAPDTFVKVWQRLATDPSIGVLGGLTILPNETLQEAGSFLDTNANVVGLGRLENPWDEYFQGVNRADYCTGSFISFRRADYDALGGLDDNFSPGYYEETDFTFRMQEVLGKKAAVDSDIQVTHFEHASFGKGRPPATAYALIKKNQAYFASKHREALRSRPSTLQLITAQGARPGAIGRSRLLVIEDLMPDTRLGSGFVRSSQILSSLTKHHVPYDLLVINPNSVVDDLADTRINVFRGWMPGQDPVSLLSAKAARYSHVMVCRTHNLVRFGAHLEALRNQYGFKVICDTEALSILRVLEIKKLTGAVVSDAERVSAVRLELDAAVHVDQWIAVSPYEREQITAAGFGPTAVICHQFDAAPPAAGKPWADRHRVIAVGAMHEPGSPNHDGLFWFMDQIYPQCAEALRELTLTMVGFWHSSIRRSFEERYPDVAIDFVGVVSDQELAALYDNSRIALAPTRFAAGVASKVLEPMMKGLPVVMTDLLADQMLGSSVDGFAGLAVGARTDGGTSFAEWVARLATDEAAWSDVQRRQYDAATPLGGIDAFESGLKAMLASVGLAHDLPEPAGR